MSDEKTLLPAWQELQPSPAYVTEFEHAFGLHRAASDIRLLQNRQTEQFYPGMAPDLLKQRAMMLELSCRLLIGARDKTLDDFCTKWCKMRGLNVQMD